MSGASGHPRRHLAFAAVAMGTYMSALDASVVNIALPTLAADFGADLDQVEWVVLAYLLTLVTFLLNAGKFADRVGTRWAYGVGLVVFGVTSALCGLSTHFLPLSLARAGQGIGGALMNAAGPAILTDLYLAHQRGRVLGMVGLAVSGGLASGPAVGGLIISALSWHWIFFVNVPIAAFAATVAFRVIPARNPRKEPFDWAGFALLGGALLAFLLALTRASRLGNWEVGTLVATAVVLFSLFLYVERRVPAPLIDLRLFRSRVFSGSAAAGFLVFVTLGMVNLVLPFYLVDHHLLAPWQMGWVLAAQPVALALASPVSGWLSDRLGTTRGLAVAGALCLAAALFSLGWVASADSLSTIVVVLAVLGLSMGLFQSPNNSALMGAVPRHSLGVAGGLLASVRVGGLLVGNGVGGAVYLAASGTGAAEGLTASAFVGACTGVLAAVASFSRGGPGA